MFRSKLFIIIVAILAVLALATGGAFYVRHRHQATQTKSHNSTQPLSPNQALSVHNTTPGLTNTSPSSSAGSASNKTPPTGSSGPAPAKPTLYNASGSPVSAGSGVGLVCNGTPGDSCVIILTNVVDSTQVITLDSKSLVSNNSQVASAGWVWTAVKGKWSMIARETSPTNKSTDSDAQIIEVN